MNKLLPCPMCGGEAEFERMGDRRQSCIVECTWCGCRQESSDEGENNGKSWNTRHTPEGWQLVPVEVTHRMSLAGKEAVGEDSDYLSAYDAMLAAAPKWGGE